MASASDNKLARASEVAMAMNQIMRFDSAPLLDVVMTYFLEDNREDLEDSDLDSDGDSGPETDCGSGPQMNCENGWQTDVTLSGHSGTLYRTKKNKKIRHYNCRFCKFCNYVCIVKTSEVYLIIQ